MQADMFGGSGRTDDAETLAALEVDYTPPAVAVQLLLALRAEIPGLRFHRALDPAAGSGCWGRAMRAVFGDGIHLTGVEPRRSELANLMEYETSAPMSFEGALHTFRGVGLTFDIVASNPPFSAFEAEGFWPLAMLEAGILHSQSVIAMLGLSSWGQSEAAAATLRSWSPALQLRLGGRAAFRGNGQTDAREYSLWVWSCADGRCREMGLRRPSWRVVQLPVLPAALRRWSPAAVPGTYPIDPGLVAEIGGRYL